MRCPTCGAANRPGMTFCCECGNSLDPDAPVTAEDIRATPLNRFPRWEVLIGAGILLVIVAVAIVGGVQDAERARAAHAYGQAQTALAAGDKDRALDAFADAGSYRDAAKQYARLLPEVTTLRTQYAAGVAAADSGAWWDAAHALRQAADVQISYRDVLTRLQTARAEAGPLFYLRPGPEGAVSLWWAQADGAEPHRLPWTDVDSEVLAVSPDARWAVYSGALISGTDRAGPFLLDLTDGRLDSLAQKYRDITGALWAQFRQDSQGFWWGADGQTYYYDMATAQALPLSETPGAIDPANGRLLLNRLILPAVGEMDSQLLLSDPLGRQRVPLATDPAEVSGAAFSDDGQFLLYVRRSVPNGAATAPTTLTLVLDDLRTDGAPASTVLETRQVTVGISETLPLQAGFLPGTHTAVALLRAGGQTTLQVWPEAGSPRTLSAPEAPLLQLHPVSGGPVLAATFGATADQPVSLVLYDLVGGRALAESRYPVAEWLAFDPHGQKALVGYLPAAPAGDDSTRRLEILDLSGVGSGVARVPASRDLPLTAQVGIPGRVPAFTRDGQRLLALGSFAGGVGLYALRPDGSDPILVVPGAAAFWGGAGAPGAGCGAPAGGCGLWGNLQQPAP